MTAEEQHVRDFSGSLAQRFKAEDLACRDIPTAELVPGLVAQLRRENEILRGKLREIERIAREGV